MEGRKNWVPSQRLICKTHLIVPTKVEHDDDDDVDEFFDADDSAWQDDVPDTEDGFLDLTPSRRVGTIRRSTTRRTTVRRTFMPSLAVAAEDEHLVLSRPTTDHFAHAVGLDDDGSLSGRTTIVRRRTRSSRSDDGHLLVSRGTLRRNSTRRLGYGPGPGRSPSRSRTLRSSGLDAQNVDQGTPARQKTRFGSSLSVHVEEDGFLEEGGFLEVSGQGPGRSPTRSRTMRRGGIDAHNVDQGTPARRKTRYGSSLSLQVEEDGFLEVSGRGPGRSPTRRRTLRKGGLDAQNIDQGTPARQKTRLGPSLPVQVEEDGFLEVFVVCMLSSMETIKPTFLSQLSDTDSDSGEFVDAEDSGWVDEPPSPSARVPPMRKQGKRSRRPAASRRRTTVVVARSFYESLAARAGEAMSHLGNAAQVAAAPVSLVAGATVGGFLSTGGAAAVSVGNLVVGKFGRKTTQRRVELTASALGQFTPAQLLATAVGATNKLAGDVADKATVKALSQGLGAAVEGGVVAGTVSLVASGVAAKMTPELRTNILANAYIQAAAEALGHLGNVAPMLPGPLQDLVEVAGDAAGHLGNIAGGAGAIEEDEEGDEEDDGGCDDGDTDDSDEEVDDQGDDENDDGDNNEE
ncbi:hypothetical protein HK104_002372 [Borealophlyctis nickersoniae]|nr:hypothetical protein HK104_002372 [Borealophlyctis nickersoniae]